MMMLHVEHAICLELMQREAGKLLPRAGPKPSWDFEVLKLQQSLLLQSDMVLEIIKKIS